MAVIRYKYTDFNAVSARQGALVLMISNDYEPPVGVPYNSIVSKVASTDPEPVPVDNPALKGAGVCELTNDDFVFVVNSSVYSFNDKGLPISLNAKGWKLYMGYNLDAPQEAGNAVGTSSYKASTTRSATGIVTEYDFGQGSTVVVGQLNARDAFAMQALQGIMEHIQKPDGVSDTEISFYTAMAYKWAANMMTAAAQARSEFTDETSQGEEIDPTTLTDNTEKILNNIREALEKTDATITIDGSEKKAERVTIPEINDLIKAYVKHTPGEGEPVTKTTVGLDDLIEAIKGIDAGGGGSTEVDFSTLITALQGLSTDRAITTLPDVNIGNTGLGRDSGHPIYISGGGFPSRQVLPAAFVAEDADVNKVIHDFLTFNAAGAVGYSTKAETKKALLGFLNDYADINTLSAAVLATLTGTDIYNKIQSNIDTRIQQWLNAARDAEGRPLTVNTPT